MDRDDFNGTGIERDEFWDMKVSSSSGNIYVTGQTSSDNGAGLDYVTVKYNSSGNAVWVRKYDGPRSSEDIAHSIAIDDSENVYITGESLGFSGDGYDYATIKYDSAGNQKWIDRYNGSAAGNDYAYSLCIDQSGNIYVTGSARLSGGPQQDYTTIKYSRGGSRLWVRSYDFDAQDYATKVIADNSGNVYVTGHVNGANTQHDYLTLKYNSSGTLLWAKRFDHLAHSNDDPSCIAVDNLGNVIVSGTSNGFVGLQYSTIKYNSNGDSLWYKEYFFTGQGNEVTAMYVDSLNNIYVTGSSRNLVIGNSDDFLTIKYAPNGSTNSSLTKRYDGPASASDIPRAIIPGANGKIFVGGGSRNGAQNGDDFTIIEYDMATMNQCFVNTLIIPGEDNINTMGYDITRGILYAAGWSTNGTGTGDGMTARYCITAPVTLSFTVKAAIEGLYNVVSNSQRIRDTLTGYLRNSFSPYSQVSTSKAVLDSATLNAGFQFPNMLSGSYYLVLTHRNSIETWSRADGETFSCGGALNYDFTNSLIKAYGSNMKQIDFFPVRYGIYSGDVNQDGIVDLTDIVMCFNDANSFISGYVVTDLNGDYYSDLSDIIITFNNSNEFVAKITP